MVVIDFPRLILLVPWCFIDFLVCFIDFSWFASMFPLFFHRFFISQFYMISPMWRGGRPPFPGPTFRENKSWDGPWWPQLGIEAMAHG
jgi:hypothetical protein